MENTKVCLSMSGMPDCKGGCCLAATCLSGTPLRLCFHSLCKLASIHPCAKSGPALSHVPVCLSATSMLKFDCFQVPQFLLFSLVTSHPDLPPSLAQCTAAWTLVLARIKRWCIWLVWQDEEAGRLEGCGMTKCIYSNGSCTYFIAASDIIY